jgi:hypothetical protein
LSAAARGPEIQGRGCDHDEGDPRHAKTRGKRGANGAQQKWNGGRLYDAWRPVA